jgi:hypothetical protein
MNILSIIKQQGIEPLKGAIDKSIRDLKQADYTRQEISETIRSIFYAYDSNLDIYIRTKGY